MGVTSQQIMELGSTTSYETETSWLRERCLQLNRETIESNELISDRDGRIKYEPEFRFMLTRHWTLFNSMLHSQYIATRLGVWRDKGRRMLETFIVKMGLPLAECKTDYNSMGADMKCILPAKISKYAAEFGLEDVLFPSFMREFGFKLRLSASDAVYSLMALMGAPNAIVEQPILDSVVPSDDASPVWIKNFYYAFDALDYSHVDKLGRGIGIAMKQQQVILSEATMILSHRLLRYGRRFRYVVLRKGSDRDWLAGHACSLTKLALFLFDATRASNQNQKPLLLAAYNPLHDAYMVVATGATVGSDATMRNNRFGAIFRRAAQMVRARVKHDGFDTAMIEVKAGDLKTFLQTLQTIPLL